jgi:hypothetical protein
MQVQRQTQQVVQAMTLPATPGRPAPAERARWATPVLALMTRTSSSPQTLVDSVPVPSASAETHTTSLNAMPTFYGTDTPQPLPGKETKGQNSEPPAPATPYAWTGTYPSHATPTCISPGTGAPAAAAMIMEPKRAVSPSLRFRISTPYIAEGWLELLESNNLITKYRHIPISLQYGFNAGVRYIARTFIPPNDESISLHHDVF